MPASKHLPGGRALSAAAVIALLGAGLVAAGGAASADPAEAAKLGDGRYIISFADEPVASYDGYAQGFAATRPQPGKKIDPDSQAVQSAGGSTSPASTTRCCPAWARRSSTTSRSRTTVSSRT
ncbi:hypothetical protein [Longispora albida]|uniref:hypothetical protein n=1 Tax=Longispora albida TaxID=203523 RepID=UPI0012FAD6AB|nr:hypothetical protein [Longispora albida]